VVSTAFFRGYFPKEHCIDVATFGHAYKRLLKMKAIENGSKNATRKVKANAIALLKEIRAIGPTLWERRNEPIKSKFFFRFNII
jgi:hypothetical protein